MVTVLIKLDLQDQDTLHLNYQVTKINSDIFVKKAVESFLENAKEGDCLILESSIEVGTTERMQEIIKEQLLYYVFHM